MGGDHEALTNSSWFPAEHGGDGYVEEGGLGCDMAGEEEEGEEGWEHVCGCGRCWK